MTEIQVFSVSEAISLFEKGLRNKTTETTKINKVSSRSHSIFTLHLAQVRIIIDFNINCLSLIGNINVT